MVEWTLEVIKAFGRQPIVEEFLNNELGDKRLSNRLVRVAQHIDLKLGSHLPQACGGWTEVMGAYRFFANERIDPSLIQNIHFLNTCARISDYEREPLLLVQDSTTFNYQSHRKTVELGIIREGKIKKSTRGIWCHSAMIYTPHGTPLGLLIQNFWLRKMRTKAEKILRRKLRNKTPFPERESYRWIQCVEAARIAQYQTQKRIIIVADSEGDINEFYRVAWEHNIGFIIRADLLRICTESKPQTIRDFLKSSHFNDKIEIDIVYRERIQKLKLGSYQRLSPQHRHAVVPIWAKEVTIKLRHPITRRSFEKKINVVLADETPEPEIKEPLSWLLFTTEKIDSNEDIKNVVTKYKCRWQIEEYHRIWKSGCKVEDCRLGSGQKLIKYLKVMGVIAWRQHYLTEIGREYAHLPASSFLNPIEIQSLKLEFNDEVDSCLTLGEAWRLIAQLGGFLNRNSDQNPGATTFWRGLQQINYTTKAIERASHFLDQSVDKAAKVA